MLHLDHTWWIKAFILSIRKEIIYHLLKWIVWKFKKILIFQNMFSPNQILYHWRRFPMSSMLMNADLFHGILLDRIICFKGVKCIEWKKSKESLTMLLATRMHGYEKIIPLVTGKSLNPPYMKNCKSLPVFYDVNLKSWMMADIWEKNASEVGLKFLKTEQESCINCRQMYCAHSWWLEINCTRLLVSK